MGQRCNSKSKLFSVWASYCSVNRTIRYTLYLCNSANLFINWNVWIGEKKKFCHCFLSVSCSNFSVLLVLFFCLLGRVNSLLSYFNLHLIELWDPVSKWNIVAIINLGCVNFGLNFASLIARINAPSFHVIEWIDSFWDSFTRREK